MLRLPLVKRRFNINSVETLAHADTVGLRPFPAGSAAQASVHAPIQSRRSARPLRSSAPPSRSSAPPLRSSAPPLRHSARFPATVLGSADLRARGLMALGIAWVSLFVGGVYVGR